MTEVRIHGDIESQRIAQYDLGIQPGAAVVFCSKFRAVERIQETGARENAVRNKLQVTPR